MSRQTPECLESVLDMEELLARCLGNLEFAERILAMFQERFGEDLDEMEKMLAAGNCEEIARLAHRIKGAAANAAAARLREHAATIEQLARDRLMADIPAHLDHMRQEWTRFTESVMALGTA